MAAVSSRCPRCRKFRPLFLVPVREASLSGQRRAFLCMGCMQETSKHDPKPLKVVEK